MREYQLAAAATHAVIDGGGRVHLLMIGSTSMQDPKLIFPNPNPSQRVLREGDIILCELAMTYMGYTAKIGHPVIDRPADRALQPLFTRKSWCPASRPSMRSSRPVANSRTCARRSPAYSAHKGAQSRPIVMHGHDLITSLPFISLDEVKGEPYDMVMQPGMAYGIEITPVSADGTFGIFFSRSFAITESGVQALTPYPVDDIIVAG